MELLGLRNQGDYLICDTGPGGLGEPFWPGIRGEPVHNEPRASVVVTCIWVYAILGVCVFCGLSAIGWGSGHNNPNVHPVDFIRCPRVHQTDCKSGINMTNNKE